MCEISYPPAVICCVPGWLIWGHGEMKEHRPCASTQEHPGWVQEQTVSPHKIMHQWFDKFSKYCQLVHMSSIFQVQVAVSAASTASPSHFHQLLQGYPKVLPGLPRTINVCLTTSPRGVQEASWLDAWPSSTGSSLRGGRRKSSSFELFWDVWAPHPHLRAETPAFVILSMEHR